MDVMQTVLHMPDAVETACAPLAALSPHVVLVFGSVALLRAESVLGRLRAAFPGAIVAGCSTAGEITAAGVTDKTCVITAIRFAATRCAVAATALEDLTAARAAGQRLGRVLLDQGGGATPTAVLMYGRGTTMNGSALVAGLQAQIGAQVPITGGLAGDDGAFLETMVIAPADAGAAEETTAAVAIGLFGETLRIAQGSYGGWQPFGPPRRVTGADGNILHSLDDEPALAVYRRYLGHYARDLPASALLFPFERIGPQLGSHGLTRTILGIDPASGSLILAGDIEKGALVRMMSASTDALIDGAQRAATACLSTPLPERGLALLVSCIGRKLVMGDRVGEEVEAVTEVLGTGITVAGFHSYGEFGPHQSSAVCQLHNQTMTVAILSED